MMITGSGPSHHVIDVPPLAREIEEHVEGIQLPQDALLIEMTNLNQLPHRTLDDAEKGIITHQIRAKYEEARQADGDKRSFFVQAVKYIGIDSLMADAGLRNGLFELTKPEMVENKCSDGRVRVLNKQNPFYGDKDKRQEVVDRYIVTQHYRNVAEGMRALLLKQARFGQDLPRMPTSQDLQLGRKILGTATSKLPRNSIYDEHNSANTISAIIHDTLNEVASQEEESIHSLQGEINNHIDSVLKNEIAIERTPVISALKTATKAGIASVALLGASAGGTTVSQIFYRRYTETSFETVSNIGGMAFSAWLAIPGLFYTARAIERRLRASQLHSERDILEAALKRNAR